MSSARGSARNLTRKFVLPSDGAVNVSAPGPAFWFGGTVTDPNSECASYGGPFCIYPWYTPVPIVLP